MEVYEARSQLRTRLLAGVGREAAAYERYLKEFPRDVSVWVKYFKVLVDSATGDQIEEAFQMATERCRKSPDVWLAYLSWLEGGGDKEALQDLANEIVDAIGNDWGVADVISEMARLCESGLLDADILDALSGLVNDYYPSLELRVRQACLSRGISPDPFLLKIRNNAVLYQQRSVLESTRLTMNNFHEFIKSCPGTAESVYQRLVFKYSDLPDSWLAYANWLKGEGRLDHAIILLETASTEYMHWNHLFTLSAAEFLNTNGEPEKSEEQYRSLLTIAWLDIGVVELMLERYPEESQGYLHALVERYPDVGYLRVLLFEVTGDYGVLQQLLDNAGRKLLAEDELLPFVFAVLNVESPDRSVIDPILSLNCERIKAVFNTDEFPTLFPLDTEGRPPPPKPRSSVPLAKPTVQLESREAKRALPGYTPGWMAAEYAKKKKL